MKYVKLFEEFNEYNYENTKNNPDKIVVKFTQSGYDKFWDNYIKSTDNWFYFGSWIDLASTPSLSHTEAKGLEMKHGEYYLLFKNYDPKDIEDYRSRRQDIPTNNYFIKYNKEAGEIGIYSSYGTEYQDIQTNNYYNTTQLKGEVGIYCRLDKGEEARVADVGSIDHNGYFEIVAVK
jgi:hypothetical protein